jgi:hypothetical protein
MMKMTIEEEVVAQKVTMMTMTREIEEIIEQNLRLLMLLLLQLL